MAPDAEDPKSQGIINVSEISDPSEALLSNDEEAVVDTDKKLMKDPSVDTARTRNYERNRQCIQSCMSTSSKTRSECRTKCTGNQTDVGPGKTFTSPTHRQVSRARVMCIQQCNGDASCEAKCPEEDLAAIA